MYSRNQRPSKGIIACLSQDRLLTKTAGMRILPGRQIPGCSFCSVKPPFFSCQLIKRSRSLQQREAFTVSIPSRSMVGQADFAGLVSGRHEDKFQTLGLTPLAGEHVDAPFVAECPVVLELLLRHTHELGSHIQFIGEIMDVKVRRDCLTPEGLPDAGRIDALMFSPMSKEYYGMGEFIARASAIGKTIARKGQFEHHRDDTMERG